MYKAELTHYPYSPNGYAALGYDAVWVLASALDKTLTQMKEKNKSVNSFSYKDSEFARDLAKMLLHTATKGITVGSLAMLKLKCFSEAFERGQKEDVFILFIILDPRLLVLMMFTII